MDEYSTIAICRNLVCVFLKCVMFLFRTLNFIVHNLCHCCSERTHTIQESTGHDHVKAIVLFYSSPC